MLAGDRSLSTRLSPVLADERAATLAGDPINPTPSVAIFGRTHSCRNQCVAASWARPSAHIEIDRSRKIGAIEPDVKPAPAGRRARRRGARRAIGDFAVVSDEDALGPNAAATS